VLLFQRKPPTQPFYPEDGGCAFLGEPVTCTKLDDVTHHMTAISALAENIKSHAKYILLSPLGITHAPAANNMVNVLDPTMACYDVSTGKQLRTFRRIVVHSSSESCNASRTAEASRILINPDIQRHPHSASKHV
jgi:hypothetical protein